MKHHRRADRIKACGIRQDRPGIIKPFLMPAKLKNQVKTGSPLTDLKFKPTGKTLVGGTQWAIKISRPGLAAPLIVAKKEQAAIKKGMAVAKAKVAAHASAKAKAKAVAVDIEAAKGAAQASAKAKPLSGWFF